MLTGNVGKDCEGKTTPWGVSYGLFSLAVNKRPASKSAPGIDNTDWYSVEIHDPTLLEEAVAKVRKGARVFVQGRIRMDQWTDKATGVKRIKPVIEAATLSFVEKKGMDGGMQDEQAPMPSYAPPPPQQPQQQAYAYNSQQGRYPQARQQRAYAPPAQPYQQAGASNRGARGDQHAETEQLWEEWANDPSQWWDNRAKKTNPKAPDFKFKDKSVNKALWIDSRTPNWVKEKLESM